jgi:aspartate/methionine/tyrosine aminotransferase
MGQVIEEEALKRLIEICQAEGIWLCSDEVYRLFGAPNKYGHLPAACLYEKGLSLGVMSKAFSMEGLWIGRIACQDKAMRKKIEQMKHQASIYNSEPSERTMLISLSNKDAGSVDAFFQKLVGNQNVLLMPESIYDDERTIFP